MRKYLIRYFSRNTYYSEVLKASFQLLVAPAENETQTVKSLDIKNSLNSELSLTKNVFGFDVYSMGLSKTFNQFNISLEAEVLKKEVNPFNFVFLDPAKEAEIIQQPDFYIDNHLFLNETTYTQLPKSFNSPFSRFDGNEQLFDYLYKLNEEIHGFIAYQKGFTNTETLLKDVVKFKMGVCQDFAHLFIAICRKQKIPARYVSGYLNQGANLTGNMFLHAWAEAYIPEIGWIGYDPTNKLVVDHNYIKIAHGLDYQDCSPIKGVLNTVGSNVTEHNVEVINQ